MSAESELQKAMFTVLDASLSVPVYDEVPQELTALDSDFPFVTMGETTLNANDDDAENGFDCTSTIHVWSRYRGRLQVKEIQGEIYNTLHRNDSLTIELPYEIYGLSFESSSTFMDGDGITRHGVQTFRIYLTQIN